jgi:fructuronate reductase/mannitol 2-dehydrogenase
MSHPAPDTAFPPLNDNSLSELGDKHTVPGYDRAALTPAVLHFGVGGFHRAHQALYFEELAHEGVTDWGVIGVGVHRREMKEVLSAQDNLFTVIERDRDHDHARVIGCMTDYLYAPEDHAAVLAALSDPRIKLVTLTVTGTSYPVNAHTGAFEPGGEEIQHDIDHPHEPCSVFGYVVEGLRLRRAAGVAPFTVLSCDNVAHNGQTTRTAITSLARMVDPELADYIESAVQFPSSMVDRITPSTSPADQEEMAEQFEVDDRWPVLTEPFRQWIIEDKFCNDRPPLNRVGVDFVEDVGPYELMKTRLLNGSHCPLGYAGLLLGYETSDQAIDDPDIHLFIEDLMAEVEQLIPPVPGIDLMEYRRTLLERFSNPRVGDRLERLAGRGSTKMASYVLPSLQAARGEGNEHPYLSLSVALWISYLGGVDDQGHQLDVVDPMLDILQPLARAGDVRGFLSQPAVFGSMGREQPFVAEVQQLVALVNREGTRAALTRLRSGKRQAGAA